MAMSLEGLEFKETWPGRWLLQIRARRLRSLYAGCWRLLCSVDEDIPYRHVCLVCFQAVQDPHFSSAPQARIHCHLHCNICITIKNLSFGDNQEDEINELDDVENEINTLPLHGANFLGEPQASLIGVITSLQVPIQADLRTSSQELCKKSYLTLLMKLR